MALSSAEVKSFIQDMLGHAVIPLELTEAHYTRALNKSLDIYNRYNPKIDEGNFQITAGQTQYQMTETQVGRGIIRVAAPPSKYRFGLGWGFGDEFSVFDSAVISDVGHYGIAIDYYRVARKVLSADFNWKFHVESRILEITPSPQEPLILYYQYLRNRFITEVPFRDEDWIKDFALYVAKYILGEIRELAASIQGTQTTWTLNGAQLKADADKHMEALIEDLKARVGDKFHRPMRHG